MKFIKSMRICAALLLLMPAMLFPLRVSAAPAHNFSVRAVIPDNQVDDNQTYFDLWMEPGRQQQLQLVVQNSGEEDLRAHASLHTASTGRNGTVRYNVAAERDASMELAIEDIARIENPDLLVPAGGSATVEVQVEMPAGNPRHGILLGGIVISGETPDTAYEPGGQSVTLETSYEYVVGLKITQADKAVRPDFHLLSIEPGLVNHRTALVINLQNSAAALAKNMQVLAQVTQENHEDIYRELRLEDAEMAPNSNGDFVVDWQTALEQGSYKLYLRVEQEGEVWEWDERFQIDGQLAGTANQNAVNTVNRPVWPRVARALCLLVLFGLLTAYLLRRRTRRARSH